MLKLENVATPLTAATLVVPDTVAPNPPGATPFAAAGAGGWVGVFPVPAAGSPPPAPLTGWPGAWRAVPGVVAASFPAVITVGAAATVDCVAEIVPATTLNAALVAPLGPAAAAVSV